MSKKKVFYSSLSTETNSFSSIRTTYESFNESGILLGDEVLYSEEGLIRPSMRDLHSKCEELGFEISVGIFASASPGLPVEHNDYIKLKDLLIGQLTSSLPVEAVVLNLHGAMMSTECDDCEGDLLTEIRQIVGKATPIGVVLDPHAHLTEKMISNSDVLIFMKEYPHIDGAERMGECLNIISKIISAEISPKAAVFDCQTIGFYPTQNAPMSDFVEIMKDYEKSPFILTVSLVHGFPWGDNPNAGAKILVYSNSNNTLASEVATQLGTRFIKIRKQTGVETVTIEEAISRVPVSNAPPLILADLADNPGGGAPSDSTFILQYLLDNKITNVAIGLIYDQESVSKCHQYGIGAEVRLRIGGKINSYSGNPIDTSGIVKGIQKKAVMDVMGIAEFPMGDTAWVNVSGIDIVFSSKREQMYAPSGFRHLGIKPEEKEILVVKSSNHFQAFFKDISKNYLYVNTPGAINFEFSDIRYENFNSDYYPRNQNLNGFLVDLSGHD